MVREIFYGVKSRRPPGLALVGTEFETAFNDQRCQDGESIIGFDAAGAMICSGPCLDGGVRRPVVTPTEGDLPLSEIMAGPELPLLDGGAEWFEVEVVSGFDLNGLELGVAPGDVLETITAEECLPVVDGELLLFARSSDTSSNVSLSPDRLFGFDLVNSAGAFSSATGTRSSIRGAGTPRRLRVSRSFAVNPTYGASPLTMARTNTPRATTAPRQA